MLLIPLQRIAQRQPISSDAKDHLVRSGVHGPQIMAVLNITPDSFSDGGKLFGKQASLDSILSHADYCLAEGATILDVGGESTRPGRLQYLRVKNLTASFQ